EEHEPMELVFLFICKADPDSHPIQKHAQGKTSSGTSNLNNTIQACDAKLGKLQNTSITKSTSSESKLYPYSKSLHQVLAVLHCAANQSPFNMLYDSWYLAELEMLQSGIKPLSAQMVSCDTKCLHKLLSVEVSKHFRVSNYFVM